MKPNFLFEVLGVCEVLWAVVPIECLTASVAGARTQNLQGIWLKKIKGKKLFTQWLVKLWNVLPQQPVGVGGVGRLKREKMWM